MWGTDGKGIVYYLNYNTIEIKDGYVFYWFLMNFLDPNSNGPKSTSIYLKADCNKFEVKPIKTIFFLEEMGKNKKNEFYYSSNEAWRSYNPNSTPGIMLKSICKKAKNFI
tara:strand:+ start:162 stop:491 length:330 start_codon:yes stop_codon:yes gene_type:complete